MGCEVWSLGRDPIEQLLVDRELLAQRLVQLDRRPRELLRRRETLPHRGALALLAEDGADELRVHGEQRLLLGVRDVREARVGGEAGRERVAADGGGRVHARDELDVLELDEVEGLVIEPLVCDELLEERDELGGLVPV